MKVPVFAVSYVASTVLVTIGVYHRSKVEIELSEESVDCSVSTGIVGNLKKNVLIISEKKQCFAIVTTSKYTVPKQSCNRAKTFLNTYIVNINCIFNLLLF